GERGRPAGRAGNAAVAAQAPGRGPELPRGGPQDPAQRPGRPATTGGDVSAAGWAGRRSRPHDGGQGMRGAGSCTLRGAAAGEARGQRTPLRAGAVLAVAGGVAGEIRRAGGGEGDGQPVGRGTLCLEGGRAG